MYSGIYYFWPFDILLCLIFFLKHYRVTRVKLLSYVHSDSREMRNSFFSRKVSESFIMLHWLWLVTYLCMNHSPWPGSAKLMASSESSTYLWTQEHENHYNILKPWIVQTIRLEGIFSGPLKGLKWIVYKRYWFAS